jgi:hypothetical protein
MILQTLHTQCSEELLSTLSLTCSDSPQFTVQHVTYCFCCNSLHVALNPNAKKLSDPAVYISM